ncbi:hypothetical protein [Salipaludibacillus sp. CF4.18]|uniref:hypothetical protein n=1 Tax=Salipaludibacillus sp. CF4.18 TaxID=3373081 RepID=UPI003EE6919B
MNTKAAQMNVYGEEMIGCEDEMKRKGTNECKAAQMNVKGEEMIGCGDEMKRTGTNEYISWSNKRVR